MLYKIIKYSKDQGVSIRETIDSIKNGYYKIVKCPICGKYIMNNYDICKNCGWEFESVPNEEVVSSANGLSIKDYKKWYNGDKTIEKRSPSFPKSWFPTADEYEKAANCLAKIFILEDTEFFTDKEGLIHKYRQSTHEFVVYKKLKDDELIYTFYPMTDEQWEMEKEMYSLY